MLTICGRYGLKLMRDQGMKRAEAIANAEVYAQKYNTALTESDYNTLINYKKGEKTMKKATRRTIGVGNNARYANIHGYTMNGLKNAKKLTRKTPKAGDCKASKKLTDRKEVIAKYIEYINKAVTIEEYEKIYKWIEIEKRIRPSDKAKLRDMLAMREREVDRKAKEKAEKKTEKKTTKKTAKASDSKASKGSGATKKSKGNTKKETKKNTKGSTTKASGKKSTKTASKKAPKKEIAKKETKAKKESAKVFILTKWVGTKLTEYQFVIKEDSVKVHKTVNTMRISRGFVTPADELEYKSGEMTVEKARRMYKALIEKGFAA